ncbi:alpha/beta hydrolase [uncultured Paraglaciecola sp.]|uniref:alpha/beta hydrolase n=1 Tax=uncultured Paraglaciecola sp. TaxID=1765024 RepID=UPI0030DDCCC7|tara:strand:- start:427463 stop:427969 length:507 start_codon:yes stop_codon:yes gene_type:complete
MRFSLTWGIASCVALITVIVPMPLNTAFLGINKADNVLAAFPQIKQWVIAGHSLGGVGAAEYIKGADLTKMKGLLLLASYPASDISALDVAVMSISGSKDLQSTPEKIALNKPKLPTNTQYVVIENANHWQFGSFAPENTLQHGLISPEAQAELAFKKSLEFLSALAP